MKMQDHQDDYKEGVPVNQEMDDQPSRGKRKCDEEDDQKPAAPLKKNVPEDDEETKMMMIKKQSGKYTLRKCFSDISKQHLDHKMIMKNPIPLLHIWMQ